MVNHNLKQDCRDFIEIEEDLKRFLNKGYKNKSEKILNLLFEMESKGFKISKQYLKNLYSNKNKNNIRSSLSYLLKNINHKERKKNKYFKEYVFKKSTDNIYIKGSKIGLFYKQNKKKVFEFIVVNPTEIKQIQQQNQDRFLRSLNLFPEMVLSYFFNLIE